MDALVFIGVALFGLIIGVISGMFGIGGGTIMIPTLNLVFGLPILSSTATSLFVIAPTAISATIRNLRTKTIQLKTAILFGVCGGVASALSSYMSDLLPALIISIATVAVIIYSAFEMLRGIFKISSRKFSGSSKLNDVGADCDSKADGMAEASAGASGGVDGDNVDDVFDTSDSRCDVDRLRIKTKLGYTLLCVGVGIFAGLVAGVVGVGGGFIIVPIVITYLGYKFKMASATSLLAIAIIAVPGIVVHAVLGHVEYLYGLALMVGSIPGANIGSRLISRFPERLARVLFSIILLISGVLLIIRNLA